MSSSKVAIDFDTYKLTPPKRRSSGTQTDHIPTPE